MKDQDYFIHLYELARHLNKEYSLNSALYKSLEKTAEILNIETAWFWLTEADNKSVYLAASYNLPPALSKHPERLSGWCYCIKQYLEDDLDQAVNISEISCSRLQDISRGTNDLKFHAVIPITIEGQKVGLMNLLSKESRALNEKELAILNTISELIGTAIQRTRLQQSFKSSASQSNPSINHILKRVFHPQLESLIVSLEKPDNRKNEALKKAKDLLNQIMILNKETIKREAGVPNIRELQYPEMPLTKRELEVLNSIKKGLTNSQIGKRLYITERTVKFHVTAILSKLNAKTRTEAVDICLKRGFLSV